MDQRTKNRLREHTKPGHVLTPATHLNGARVIASQKGNKAFKCKCGWFGWLPNGSVP